MPQDPDHWTTEDAVKLRQYLASHPKFLRALAKQRPEIKGETMEARAVTGSDLNGFLIATDAIESMQQDPRARSESAGFIHE